VAVVEADADDLAWARDRGENLDLRAGIGGRGGERCLGALAGRLASGKECHHIRRKFSRQRSTQINDDFGPITAMERAKMGDAVTAKCDEFHTVPGSSG